MTSRVRCSCGRVYDPAKHTTCPDCGAESAVESVVVAEKIREPSPPDLNREHTQHSSGAAGGTTQTFQGRTQPAKSNAIFIGTGVVLVLGLLWLAVRAKPRDQAAHRKGDVVQVTPVPSQQPSPSSPGPEDGKSWQVSNIVSPTPAPSAVPSPVPPVAFQDPRLVGAWETKGPWPPNSGRMQTAHWTIETDGHFTFSGPWSDTGGLTASDGRMQWFSNNSAQPVGLTYQFNGEMLTTHGPLGDAIWWRAKRSNQQSRRSTQKRSNRTTVPEDAVKREILKRMFNHFGR